MTPLSRRLLLAAVFCVPSFLTAPTASAATKTAADIVPADCLFFSTSLKLREQYEAVANSKALRRLLQLPLVQQGLGEMKRQDEYRQAMEAVESPIGQKMLAALKDISSKEIFVYGGDGWMELLHVFVEFQQQNMMATFGAAMSGKEPNPAPALVSAILKHKDLKLPPIVFGLKVEDRGNVDDLLGMLDGLIKEANVPIEVKKTEIGKGSYRVVEVSGDTLPINKEDMAEDLTQAGVGRLQAEDLHAWIAGQKVALAIGFFGDYMIVSFGGDVSHLEKLGGANALANAPELAVIRKHLDKPELCEISYLAKDFMAFNRFDAKGANELFEKTLVPAQAFLPPGLGDRLLKDGKKLIADIDASMPPASEIVQVTLFKQGFETFLYSRSPAPGTDYGKPLGVLRHAGSARPLLAAAGGAVSSRPGYDAAVEWAKTFYGYFVDFGLPLIGEEERKHFRRGEEVALPLVHRLHEITRDKLLPSMDAGQSLLVVDTQLRIRQLFGPMALERAMPVPEIGVAFTLNDGDLFVEAMGDYLNTVEEYAPRLAAVAEAPLPEELKIPRPVAEKQQQGGTRYYYPLPPLLDSGILPHALVGKKLLILSYSPSLTQRMAAGDAKLDAGSIDVNGPSGSVAVFQLQPLLAAARDWLELGLTTPDSPIFTEDKEQAEMIRVHAHAAMDFLGSMRGAVSRSFKEGEYVVHHTSLEFRDADGAVSARPAQTR